MAATIEDMDFIAPAIAGMPGPDKEKALEMAAAYRPACLPEAKQDEAQILYAAWLLMGRLQQQEGGVRPYGVVMEKEGDLQRTWGSGDAAHDPMGYYGRWKALSDICTRMGAITVAPRGGCCGPFWR